jgi:hypothetical protein
MAAVHFADDFQSHEQFADAHGMDPEPFASAEALPQSGAIASQPLGEIAAVVAATHHPQQIRRQRGEQENGKNNVVKKSHQASCFRRYKATQACP